MVHGIIYFVMLAIIVVINAYHHGVERKLNAELDWWRKVCIENENELNALKEKQPKRKTTKK